MGKSETPSPPPSGSLGTGTKSHAEEPRTTNRRRRYNRDQQQDVIHIAQAHQGGAEHRVRCQIEMSPRFLVDDSLRSADLAASARLLRSNNRMSSDLCSVMTCNGLPLFDVNVVRSDSWRVTMKLSDFCSKSSASHHASGTREDNCTRGCPVLIDRETRFSVTQMRGGMGRPSFVEVSPTSPVRRGPPAIE